MASRFSSKAARYLTCLAVGMAAASTSHAAGFQLKEQGADMQGTSFAGATAKGDNLSTLFFNPAGMSRFKGNHGGINFSLIRPEAELSISNISSSLGGGTNFPAVTDSNGGDAGTLGKVPTIYGVMDVNDKVNVGIAITVPFGLSTQYDPNWAGRYYAQTSEVETINIAPTLSYKVSDKLALGAGVQVQHTKARLTNAVNIDAVIGGGAPDADSELKGDDTSWGFNVGALYDFNDDTRFGISYRSRVHHELEGDINLTGVPLALAGVPTLQDADAKAKLVTPDSLSIGLFHQMNEKLAVMADASWTNWSLFKDLIVQNKSNNLVRQHVEEKWNDTYFFSLGAEYKYDPKTTLQAGIAYDKGAVDDDYRTFRIPDTDRYWLSVGYQRDLSDKTQFTAGFSHIIAQDATVTEDANTLRNGSISGTFHSSVNILSLGLRHKF